MALNNVRKVYIPLGYGGDFLNYLIGKTNRVIFQSVDLGQKKLNECIGNLKGKIITLNGLTNTGKTSFCLQLASQILIKNRKNTQVIYFSTEQSRDQLFNKMVSYLSKLTSDEPLLINKIQDNIQVINDTKIIDPLLILNSFLDRHNDNNSFMRVEEQGNTRNEEDGDTKPEKNDGLNQLKFYINQALKKNENVNLIVFVDFLQDITIEESKSSYDTKKRIDFIFNELRELARQKGVTFFLISSVNRESYEKRIMLSSSKESGDIEFKSDIILGLNLKGAIEPLESPTRELKDEIEKCGGKAEYIRQKSVLEKGKDGSIRKGVFLEVLKNRDGEANQIIPYCFYPQFSYFQPIDKEYKKEEIEDTITLGGIAINEIVRKFSKMVDYELKDFIRKINQYYLLVIASHLKKEDTLVNSVFKEQKENKRA